jgi:hypothetical protein
MATKASISAQADANMLKEIIKLIHRIERILVPINSLVHTNIGEKLDGLLVEIKKGKYFEDVNKFPVQDLIGYDVRSIEPLFRKVAWEKLGMAIWTTLNDGNEEYFLPDAVINEIAMERQVHEDKLQKAVNKERVRRMQVRISYGCFVYCDTYPSHLFPLYSNGTVFRSWPASGARSLTRSASTTTSWTTA